MPVALHQLFRESAEAAARVNSSLAAGISVTDAQLDELATSQRACLDALHARLRQKTSVLGLASVLIARPPSLAFVSDFSDSEQCVRYAVKCCEECSSCEHMRQLVPLLRCFQNDAPNHSALTPLFVRMGGLVALLEWVKRTATQLKESGADSCSMPVLTGVLHIVSKFSVLPKQTVPSGACSLLLDIMGCRLPPVSACVAAVLRCWMKCAERNAAAAGSTAALKPKLAPPAAHAAAIPALPARSSALTSLAPLPRSTPPCGSAPLPRSSSTACGGNTHAHKLTAELCEDEAEAQDGVQQGKHPCSVAHLAPPISKRSAASAVCAPSYIPPQPRHPPGPHPSHAAYASNSRPSSFRLRSPPHPAHKIRLTSLPNSSSTTLT